jgi:hypothetical protein
MAAKKQFPMYSSDEEVDDIPEQEEDDGVLTQEEVDAVDDDDEPPDDEPEKDDERPPRRERRRQRLADYQGQVAAREEAEKRLAAEQEEKRQIAERLARLEGAAFARQPQVQPQDQEAEYLKKRDKLLAEQDAIVQQWGALSEDERASRREEFVRRNADKEDEIARLRLDRYRPAVDPTVAARQQEAAAVMQANEDILADPEAKRLVSERWEEWKRSGRPTTPEAGRMIFNSVRRDLNMYAFSRKPNEHERSRYTGISSRGTATAAPKTSVVRLNEEQKKMARALYADADISDKQAYARFYKEVVSQD